MQTICLLQVARGADWDFVPDAATSPCSVVRPAASAHDIAAASITEQLLDVPLTGMVTGGSHTSSHDCCQVRPGAASLDGNDEWEAADGYDVQPKVALGEVSTDQGLEVCGCECGHGKDDCDDSTNEGGGVEDGWYTHETLEPEREDSETEEREADNDPEWQGPLVPLSDHPNPRIRAALNSGLKQLAVRLHPVLEQAMGSTATNAALQRLIVDFLCGTPDIRVIHIVYWSYKHSRTFRAHA